mmetsp:Transcript_43808/g.59857  ORF Transcript_43808/g.59857 Transcript_43808/m.59857 type:complete len:228 (-) Transcript_43808:34-717(-)
MYGSAIAWGGYFWLYEHAKIRWGRFSESSSEGLAPGYHLLAAAESGAILVLLTNPIWLVKTRMQLQQQVAGVGNSRVYRSVGHALSTIVREEGVPALWKGTIPALLLVSHGAVQFTVYEWLKKQNLLKKDQASSIDFLAMGAVAKVVASVSTYPAQVIKARLQQRDLTLTSGPKYHGVRDCAVRIWKNEGPFGFFKGCLPNIARVAPGAALTFWIYEATAGLIRGHN